MAASCCVVSTPLAGVKEQIEDGVSGLLARDMSAKSLAKALNKAVDNKDKCRQYGKKAREKIVENFSEEKMISAHLNLYQELMAKK